MEFGGRLRYSIRNFDSIDNSGCSNFRVFEIRKLPNFLGTRVEFVIESPSTGQREREREIIEYIHIVCYQRERYFIERL